MSLTIESNVQIANQLSVSMEVGLAVIDKPILVEQLALTPSTATVEHYPSSGYYFDKVTANAVTSEIDGNIQPLNIREGVTILGVEGNLEPDKPDQSKTVSATYEEQVITADTGYELASVTVNALPLTVLGTKEITANGTYNAVDDSLDGYSAVTVNVQGGEEPVESGFRVRFIDYDGTVLKTEYVESGNNATPPDLPTHDNLTFQEWNNDFTNIMQDIDIGATYTTTDGMSSFDIQAAGGTPYAVFVLTELTPSSSSFAVINAVSTIMRFPYPLGIRAYSRNNFKGNLRVVLDTSIKLKPDISLYTPFVYGDYDDAERKTKADLYAVQLASGITLAVRFFYNQLYIKKINLPLGSVVYERLFQNCYSLNSIVLPNGVVSIGIYAFQNCYSLNSVVLPNSLTDIGAYAFQNCGSLKSIIIPDSVTSIGAFAFYRCGCETITLGSGISSILTNTFSYCGNCKKLIIKKEDAVITLGSNINYFNADFKIYVPDTLLNDYKAATNWATLASRIYPMSEMEA